MIIELRPTQNEGPRPVGNRVSLVVLHGTEGSDKGDLEWLLNPQSQRSYHYLIQRTGHVIRLVDESRRAWHAGRSSWLGRSDVNDISIGIGLSNKSPEAYTPAQYRALAGLLAGILDRHRLDLDDIVGHYNVALPLGRKGTDPGPHFQWGRLFKELMDIWGGPAPAA